MRLNFRKTGTGFPLVILHGLYGSGSNWFSIATDLGSSFTVYMPDQRNHGDSPHSDELNYELMTSDLETFFIEHNIEKACLMGHSMGGKIAMDFTLKNPSKVEKLIVVDVALRSYAVEGLFAQQAFIHRNIVDSLKSLDISNTQSRKEIDNRLSLRINQLSVRQFLLKNLKRNEKGNFYWGMNIQSLDANLHRMLDGVQFQNKAFTGRVLVISGKNSGYIKEDDLTDFKTAFPKMIFTEFDSGHWVHIEQTEKFLECIKDFLLKVE
jgi:esterase